MQGIGAWQRAVKLDPDLCPAQLRIAIYGAAYPDVDAPVAFEAARGCAATLSDRDRALLDVAASLFAQAPSLAGLAAAVGKIAPSFPDDPELQYLRAIALSQSDPAAAVAAFDRVIQLDPKFVHAYSSKQLVLTRLGKTEEAEQAIVACLGANPGAVLCGFAELQILLGSGRCAEAESEARAFITNRPSNSAAYDWLSSALMARAAPEEAVEAALEQSQQRQVHGTTGAYRGRTEFMEQEKEVYGDFTAALALLDERDRGDANLSRLQDRVGPLVQRVGVLQEMGRTDEARRVVRSFLRRSDGYAFPSEAYKVPAVVAGVMLGLEPISALVDLMNRAPDFLPKGATAVQRWAALYIRDDPSPAFARAAVAQLPHGEDLEGVRALFAGDEIALDLQRLGTLLARGGRADLAVPWLREGLKSCLQQNESLSRRHAELELGKALEAQGDKAGAREQYQSILRYWGDAKPRSVTADEARRRLAALGP
jgi:tetratricopeptide (TPR) repeat protein